MQIRRVPRVTGLRHASPLLHSPSSALTVRQFIETSNRSHKITNAILIDSPPRVTDIARSAILAADLVVIPVQPSPFDIWAAQDTVKLIADSLVYKENIQSAFAINREIVNTAIGRDVSDALSKSEIPVLTSHVSQRVAFAESIAHGQTVFETKTDRKAASEIEALGAELLDLLGLRISASVRRST